MGNNQTETCPLLTAWPQMGRMGWGLDRSGQGIACSQHGRGGYIAVIASDEPGGQLSGSSPPFPNRRHRPDHFIPDKSPQQNEGASCSTGDGAGQRDPIFQKGLANGKTAPRDLSLPRWLKFRQFRSNVVSEARKSQWVYEELRLSAVALLLPIVILQQPGLRLRQLPLFGKYHESCVKQATICQSVIPPVAGEENRCFSFFIFWSILARPMHRTKQGGQKRLSQEFLVGQAGGRRYLRSSGSRFCGGSFSNTRPAKIR